MYCIVFCFFEMPQLVDIRNVLLLSASHNNILKIIQKFLDVWTFFKNFDIFANTRIWKIEISKNIYFLFIFFNKTLNNKPPIWKQLENDQYIMHVYLPLPLFKRNH